MEYIVSPPRAQRRLTTRTSFNDVVSDFEQLSAKKRMHVDDHSPPPPKATKHPELQHTHNTRATQNQRIANTMRLREVQREMICVQSNACKGGLSDMYTPGAEECKVERWKFYTQRHNNQRAAHGMCGSPLPTAPPQPHHKPPLPPQPQARVECKASARLWIFAAGGVLNLNPYVLHTATHIFDMYASVRSMRSHQALQYAGVALWISSKECGAAGHEYGFVDREYGTVILSDLKQYCSFVGCDMPTLHAAASVVSGIALPAQCPEHNTYYSVSNAVFVACELDMLSALDWDVANKVTLMHFTAILLDVIDATKDMRDAVDNAAATHCVEHPAFSTDSISDALYYVNAALALAPHDSERHRLLSDHMLAVCGDA